MKWGSPGSLGDGGTKMMPDCVVRMHLEQVSVLYSLQFLYIMGLFRFATCSQQQWPLIVGFPVLGLGLARCLLAEPEPVVTQMWHILSVISSQHSEDSEHSEHVILLHACGSRPGSRATPIFAQLGRCRFFSDRKGFRVMILEAGTQNAKQINESSWVFQPFTVDFWWLQPRQSRAPFFFLLFVSVCFVHAA